jgi:large-conductance mechanosensitive channel
MTSDQTTSLLWLWVLQIAWWLAAMLPLAGAVILIALAIRWLHRRARAIEKKPVEPGPRGFLNLVQDYISHLTIGKAVVPAIIGGLALGGLLAVYLQGFIQPEVHKVIEQEDFLKPEAAETPIQGVSLDFILLLALVFIVFTVFLSVRMYRSLSQRAAELAAQLEGQDAPRPLLVRLFHDSRKLGILVLVIGAWLFFGMAMQVVSLLVLVVPLPRSVAGLSFPFATTAVIWLLLALMVVVSLAFYGPAVWMGVRNIQLQFRYYQENRTFRILTNVVAAFGAGAFGALLNMHLLDYLGRLFWPSIFK